MCNSLLGKWQNVHLPAVRKSLSDRLLIPHCPAHMMCLKHSNLWLRKPMPWQYSLCYRHSDSCFGFPHSFARCSIQPDWANASHWDRCLVLSLFLLRGHYMLRHANYNGIHILGYPRMHICIFPDTLTCCRYKPVFLPRWDNVLSLNSLSSNIVCLILPCDTHCRHNP